jgi:AcrR family transcriptional regulator
VGTIATFQRSRMLAAALAEAAHRGPPGTSVAVIVARAGVSRKTFYEHFTSREDCFHAAFEQAIEEIAQALAPVYEDCKGGWPRPLRAALAELVGILERDRETAVFVLGYLIEGPLQDRQTLVYVRLRAVLEEGRPQADSRRGVPPLAAEMLLGGMVSILYERARTDAWDLSALVNPMMWMIVLSYRGPAAAARELSRKAPARAPAACEPERRSPLTGLNMRVTYRTARVLGTIAAEPGLSNVEICVAAGVMDQGQISKLLARLAGHGLLENIGPGWSAGGANAWHLTARGREVAAAIRGQFAANGLPRSAS